jgi:NAD(P)H-hydrate repair Nnr-like enzyme with NAD(P)H-hydrate dehydratase domain
LPSSPTQHVLIIGPGLGRSDHTQNCARAAFELAKESDIGVVVDADGLFLVAVSRYLTIRYARTGETDDVADVKEVDMLWWCV